MGYGEIIINMVECKGLAFVTLARIEKMTNIIIAHFSTRNARNTMDIRGILE